MLAVTAIGAIGGLTFVLASLLVLANRKLHVEEDPRIDVVEELLPHANCGACGFAGCRPFAEALVQGGTLPGPRPRSWPGWPAPAGPTSPATTLATAAR